MRAVLSPFTPALSLAADFYPHLTKGGVPCAMGNDPIPNPIAIPIAMVSGRPNQRANLTYTGKAYRFPVDINVILVA
jgi:hypothetical protein